MTPEQAAALLAPFPPETIGKLPRVTCKACTEANKKQWGTTCDRHSKVNCSVCGNWISERHIHLDYVGHAATTKRLLDVDPEWTWEPVATDANGAPALANGGLWIRMTVCGVTRLGWGDGPDIKQMISDAIRNAAMRFGVALDLWSKEDLRSDENAEGPAAAGKARAANDAEATAEEPKPSAARAAPSATSTSPSANKATEIKGRVTALIAAKKSVADKRAEWNLPKVDDSDAHQLELWDEMLTEMERELVGAKT